eukprot:TRINITY_DN5364_c0_g4_i1.p1 TRINITY_DN5364_c0_g4~~TRINITY_DN5364_c0_g4_i1.p1  ORF type:complete len:111 (-),score=8.65 TRINITY_DN5364_c0_g4_i1:256-588(-)
MDKIKNWLGRPEQCKYIKIDGVNPNRAIAGYYRFILEFETSEAAKAGTCRPSSHLQDKSGSVYSKPEGFSLKRSHTEMFPTFTTAILFEIGTSSWAACSFLHLPGKCLEK